MNRTPLRAISDEDRLIYRRDGAVCLRQVFDRDWIDALLPIARRIVVDREDVGLLPHRPVNFMTRVIPNSASWRSIHPSARRAGEPWNRAKCVSCSTEIFAKPPRSDARTVWHNDRAGWPVTGKMIPSFWMPLTPIVKANSLEVIAGTQNNDVLYWNSTANSRQMVKPEGRCHPRWRGGAQQSGIHLSLMETWNRAMRCSFHPWVLHYSFGNPTDEWRIAVSIRPLGDDIRCGSTPRMRQHGRHQL